ncbi:purine-cytosine permease family protein [Streptomyces sp. NPDC102364]|uniref:purine-cytosine permease family protein n=1 Tax=Streptomyces sp. NPDC102364 TaxID=3366161 RepID=UPI0037F92A52
MGGSSGAARHQGVPVESNGIEHVSEDERRGRVSSSFTLWFSGNLQYSAIVVGALPTAFLGLSFGQAALALTVGTLVGSLLLGLTSSMGPRAGTAQMVQSRGPFGYLGNFLPTLLLFMTGFGFFAVNTALGAYIVRYLFGIPFLGAVVLVAGFQMVIVVIGHDLVHKVERALVPVMGVLFVVVTVYGLMAGHLTAPGKGAEHGVVGAMLTAVALSSSRTFGFAICASDYTRYLPIGTSRKKVTGATFLGAAVAGLWMHLLGAAIGSVIFPESPTDLVTAIAPSAVAVLALIPLLASTVAAGVIDIYSGSLALLIADIPMRRWVSALVTGVAGGSLAWWAGLGDAAFANFQNFLFVMGYWVGPWLGVTLTDHLMSLRGDGVRPAWFYDRTWRVGPGLPAFVLGVLVSVPFMNQTLYVGPLAARYPFLGDITYWIGGAVAALAYWAIRRTRNSWSVRDHAARVAQDTAIDRSTV